MKITSILFVDAIEPCLPFWVDRIGMQKLVGVPETGPLDFVILTLGAAELMLQTRASAVKDIPQIAPELNSSFIFFEVADFNKLLQQVEGLPVIMPVRDAFYGMREILVREPGGNLVCFAMKL